jgi:hypothetical protein
MKPTFIEVNQITDKEYIHIEQGSVQYRTEQITTQTRINISKIIYFYEIEILHNGVVCTATRIVMEKDLFIDVTNPMRSIK